jgi:hypothetical protein
MRRWANGSVVIDDGKVAHSTQQAMNVPVVFDEDQD